MKELKKKLFLSGIEFYALILIAIINAVNSIVCLVRGELAFSAFTAIFVVMFICSAVRIAQYHWFLKIACENPERKHISYEHYVSRIKLKFDTFLPMYLANETPWKSTEESLMYYKVEASKDSWCCSYEEHFTIVYFDYQDYLKYRAWEKDRERLEKESAKKKAETEFIEKELKLNLEFIDTVTKDVKKMKASAEEEMQKAAEELKKAARQK